MKKLLTLATSLMLLVACATSSFQSTAGKTLVTTAVTVDAAMKGWATYVVLNNVPEDKQTTVRTAYGNYQVAFDGAQKAYTAVMLTNDQTIWGTASAALIAAQSTLTKLVTMFSTPATAK